MSKKNSKNLSFKKDYVDWIKTKVFINNEGLRPFYHEREVWWCSIGENIGFEQDGKGDNFSRPVLILKVFNKEIFICLPITTKIKNNKYYFNIDLGDNISRQVILSQIRLIDSKRLQEKIVTINDSDFNKIKLATIELIK